MTECIFCDIIKGEKPATKIYENSTTLAFLDIYPVAKGHVLVIPKKHSRNLFDIEDEDMKEVALTIKKVSNAMKAALKCDGINIYQGNERAAQQLIFHTHFHVISRDFDDNIRFEGDREELVIDEDFVNNVRDQLSSSL